MNAFGSTCSDITAQLDQFTIDLLNKLHDPVISDRTAKNDELQQITDLVSQAENNQLTGPIISLFSRLLTLHDQGVSLDQFSLGSEQLIKLAVKHQDIDEHMVSVGGRVTQALPIASTANDRVEEYLAQKSIEAPSGIELHEQVEENRTKIMQVLNMGEDDWNSFAGQIKYAIDSVDTLAEIIDLPKSTLEIIAKVTKSYRMRLTPYYASLIMPGKLNDPIMLQSVPTGEMIENCGVEIPPVAADHSPARLVDQFYPRVLTIKATNMCAMYCTHCLRLAHIGKKDKVYSKEAYSEALDYIRNNERVRDVLITGGDALLLPNSLLEWILGELDSIDHIKAKRLGTRIPVTAPMRIDNELLEIIEASNDKKPIRLVTQVNTAQEISRFSHDVFRKLSKSTFTILNQAVLLKGINDSRAKMWKLCETVHEAYIRPYYLFNCSYRNPQFKHFRVPLAVGQDLVESMYGNISGDAIPRYIATAGGKIPLHRSNIVTLDDGDVVLKKPWSGEEVHYPDADIEMYNREDFAFRGE